MADDAEIARKQSENAIRRSRVRQMVTYVVIYTYLDLAVAVTLWLMWAGRYEVALRKGQHEVRSHSTTNQFTILLEGST